MHLLLALVMAASLDSRVANVLAAIREPNCPRLLPQWTDLDPAYKQVTLEMLLQHRAGLPANISKDLWRAHWQPNDPVKMRSELVHTLLRNPPEKPGGFLYSNAGYMTAGVVLERSTGLPWEQLITKRLFIPLDMSSCGFGAPATRGRTDQPWAHRCDENKCSPVEPGPKSDNPPALGPAGTVHCSLTDWGKFVTMHLKGEQGTKTLISAESMKKLHAPGPDGKYAMGWAIEQRAWGGGRLLRHNGSNTMFYATVWIAPGKNLAFLTAANRGDDNADRALDDITGYLVGRYAQ